MTKIVKGAGRAKHAANARHQQRTPLPPRGSKAKTPAQLEAEREVTRQAVTGRKPTLAQKFALAAEEAGWEVERIKSGIHKIVKASRGDELIELKFTNDIIIQPLGFHRIGNAEQKLRHVSVATRLLSVPIEVALATPIKTTVTVSPPQQFALAAEAAGWEVQRIKEPGDRKIVKASRGDEVLTLSWTHDIKDNPVGMHKIAGHEKVLRHVTVATRLLNVDPETAVSAVRESVARKGKLTTTVRRHKTRMPFNPGTTSDVAVLEAVKGHEVRWMTRYTANPETAVVPLNGVHTRLDVDDVDDPATRQLTFCDARGEGYRTMRLSQIIYVSPHVVPVKNKGE